MSEEKGTVYQFKQKEDNVKGFIRITHDTGYKEELQVDSFGPYQDIPGFIVLWRENPEELVGFRNTRFIREIEIIKEEDAANIG